MIILITILMIGGFIYYKKYKPIIIPTPTPSKNIPIPTPTNRISTPTPTNIIITPTILLEIPKRKSKRDYKGI
jgi:hypothetical protein